MVLRWRKWYDALWVRRCFIWGMLLVLLVYLAVAFLLKQPLFAPSAHDSYTLQAMHWRQGLIYLPDGADYDWLELAQYQGKYYVSFPPFPTVPMLLLSLVFGSRVPSMLVNLLMYLASYCLGYAMARRADYSDATSAAFGAFWVLGCNLLIIALFGGVWNIAQGMSFLLTMLFFYGMVRGTPRWLGAGLICLACAVGCRPFQAAYVPLGLWIVYQKLRAEDHSFWHTLRRMIPYVIVPGLIAVAYGLYNYVRFDNPFEFGHTYLPEFQEASHGQLSVAYVGKNLRNIFRLPTFSENQLRFPDSYGFAFYLCNPMFLVFALRFAVAGFRRRLKSRDFVLLGCLLLHFFLLLLHKSFGAWQFGTRYLVDLLPAMGWFVLNQKTPIRISEGALMLFGVVFNAYGTVLFFNL